MKSWNLRNAFTKTKEISIGEFAQIWALGGISCTGAQFDNCNSHTYLRVDDSVLKAEAANANKALKEMLATRPTESGAFGMGVYFVEAADREEALRLKAIAHQDIWVGNINERHDAGWVTAGARACGNSHNIGEVPTLPTEWKECWLEHKAYPRCYSVLVACNNQDGTVQLFLNGKE